ncbi:hypothetical protein L210DRAFT_3523520 [Boletus edulis BED1]|uniref:Uncharacterized protein n=1 Tax=Boletus edulis BED1 TaxID=1328754 RepID=A0AAD4C653_BOLED|nr:hypothetical protein L210DRAFT_3523520 [Boletus edulis BED1]
MKSTSSSSRAVDGDSLSLSQPQPQFDRDSSDTSVTLVTSTSGKSASESDSHIFSDSHSDKSSERVRDNSSAPPSIDPMADVPPVSSSPQEEEITLARSVSSSPSRSPPVPQAPRIATLAQPIRSTSASPAPVYIPRLTAPSMFLPIPNVRPTFPLSYPLVWWLAPRRSPGSSFSLSSYLTRLTSPRSSLRPTFSSPQRRNLLPLSSPRSRRL